MDQPQQQTVPMTELAESVLQLHIQNASLMKQLKEAHNQIKMQADLLGQMGAVEKDKPQSVVAEKG